MSEPLSPRVPDLAALDVLVTVARVGSLGKAASVHGLSQQAVSARVRTAERLLGVQVFDRSSTGVTLTAAGELLLAWVEEVLDAASHLAVGAAELRGERDTHLTVAASMTVAEYLVPQWTVTMRMEHPEVATAVRLGNSSEVVELVRLGAVELGFVESPEIPAGLQSQVVDHDDLVVIVPPDHRWAGRRVTMDELAATPLIQREAGSGTRTTLERALPDAVAALLELSSTTAVKAAVLASSAPAVISSLGVAGELADGRLVAVTVSGLRLRRPLRAIWRDGVRLRGPARDFLAIASRP